MVSFDLEGKTALVTGAGRGLGKAIADGLAEAGAVVYGTSRQRDAADAIAHRYGTSPVTLEMTDPAAMRRDIAGLLDRSGGIDLLVNNAGINIPKPAVDVTDDDWDAVFDTNLRGPFALTTALARTWLAASTRGAVVNVASQAGVVAIEERAAYGTSKAALIHLTKQLTLEWAPSGIRVNAVAPTFVRTELTESTLTESTLTESTLTESTLSRPSGPTNCCPGYLRAGSGNPTTSWARSSSCSATRQH
ncbi:hypothetical protein NIIDNTM18_53620 [Mycolicibacterium litorale]|uniref:2-deoxy-D-gluconate 3-dehydrogenase n=1 Tax=Mycolicibacterium litorale TaxID=758802 RepID=A0A6S6PBG3_9MYCO|nr:hypothetical protein NIIDNTM18_53620 [Mycolicibacterium litorale]